MSLGNLQNEGDLKRWLQRELATPGVLPPSSEPQIVRGQVSGTGVVMLGAGFAAAKTGTGAYEITLATELGATGILLPVATEFNRIPRVAEQGKQVFKVTFVNLGEAAADTAFNFWVVPS